MKTCRTCQKEYFRKPNKAFWQYEKSLFCSKSCKGKTQGFQLKEQPVKICIKCSNLYIKKPKQPMSYWINSKFCSQPCYHSWKKARDRNILSKHLSRRSPAYKDWKLSVFKRDKWKCRMSNKDCVDKLEAHHILRFKDFPELRYEVNNGITLCVFHHPRKRTEEDRLAPVFNEILWQL